MYSTFFVTSFHNIFSFSLKNAVGGFPKDHSFQNFIKRITLSAHTGHGIKSINALHSSICMSFFYWI